jgi:hypothetical protein
MARVVASWEPCFHFLVDVGHGWPGRLALAFPRLAEILDDLLFPLSCPGLLHSERIPMA